MRGVIARPGDADRPHGDLLGGEAGRQRARLAEAVIEDSGADERDDGERHLRHDEHRAHARRAYPADRTAAALGKSVGGRFPRSQDRRRRAGENRDEHRERGGEGEDVSRPRAA